MNAVSLHDGSRDNPFIREVAFREDREVDKAEAASVFLLRAAATGLETKRRRQLPLSPGIKLPGCDEEHNILVFSCSEHLHTKLF